MPPLLPSLIWPSSLFSVHPDLSLTLHLPPVGSILLPLPGPVISYHIKSTFDKYSSQLACVTLIVRFSGMSQQLKVCMDVCVSMIASEV